MFGFQTAHKQIQIGRRSAARHGVVARFAASSGRESRESPAQRPQQQQGGFRARREPRKTNWTKFAASAPQDIAPAAVGERQRSFPGERIVEQRVANRPGRFRIARAGVGHAGARADCRERASKASPAAFQALPEGPAWRRCPGVAVESVVGGGGGGGFGGGRGGGGFGGPGGQRRRPGGNGGFIGNRSESRAPGHPRQCVVPVAGRRHRRQAVLVERPAGAAAELQQLPLERACWADRCAFRIC